jgi:hypothetical protein
MMTADYAGCSLLAPAKCLSVMKNIVLPLSLACWHSVASVDYAR